LEELKASFKVVVEVFNMVLRENGEHRILLLRGSDLGKLGELIPQYVSLNMI